MWLATLASHLGNSIQAVGASWLMTSIAPSPDMVALVQSAATLPIGLFALLAGAIADLYDRRLVMLAAQLVMLTVCICLAVLAWRSLAGPWLLLGLTFLLGTGFSVYGPSLQASIGELVPRADLPGAVSLNVLGLNVARSIGPAIGGGIVALGGPAIAFAFSAVAYLGTTTVLAHWRRQPPPREKPPEGIARAVLTGLSYARGAPAIRTVLLRTIAFGLGGSAAWALMPLVARDLIGAGALAFGLLLGSLGFGAVLGALLNTRLRRHLSNEALVRCAGIVYGAACLVTAFSPWLPLTMAVLVIGGAGWVQALSTFNVVLQLRSPRWVVGRALSMFQTAIFGSMALGSWLWGHYAESFGIAAAVATSGAVMLVLPVLGLVLRMPADAVAQPET